MSGETCDVCGRTILAGERTREYLTADGERRAVCALCRARAEGAGWVPAERAAELSTARGRARGRERRGGSRVRRLLGLRPRPSAPATSPSPEAGPPPSREPPVGGDGPGAAGGRRSRRRGIPQSPERRMRRALEAFNASEHRRTVAALVRSLGSPSVCVATPAGAPAEVRVTVAWELSWYQWEVDLSGNGMPVRELAKGGEPGELAAADRAWNARASEGGELRLGLRARRPAGGEGAG